MSGFFLLIRSVTTHSLKIRLVFFTITIFLISLFDLVALLLFAKIFSSIALGDTTFVPNFLRRIHADFLIGDLRTQYAASMSIVIILVLVKSVGILTVNRFLLTTLSRSFHDKSNELTRSYLFQDMTLVKSRSTYEISLAVNNGVREIFMSGLYAFINCVVEVCVIVCIFIVIIFRTGVSAIFLITLISLLFFGTLRFTGKRIRILSETVSTSNLQSGLSIQTLVETMRELRVFNSYEYFFSKNETNIKIASHATVDLQLLGYLPKMIIETSFIVGIAIFSLVFILKGDIANVVTQVGFFLAMGSRIIPSLLRLQAGINQIKQADGASTFTKQILNLQNIPEKLKAKKSKGSLHAMSSPFNASIEFDSVSYAYSESSTFKLDNISFKLDVGRSLGIIGRSGCGKSTVLDILCGVVQPTSGFVRISATDVNQAELNWQNSVGFIPQQIPLIDGTIRENLLLGRSRDEFSERDYWEALRFANLLGIKGETENWLDHPITRAGSELSGGQRQRLGIARAMLARPRILILDEATSALDSQTEKEINKSLASLDGQVTRVIVSHKINSLMHLDSLLLLEDGKVVATGTYDELLKESGLFRTFIAQGD